VKIVSWNCKGGFSRKHEAISHLDADILILPEAGRLDGLTHVLGGKPITSSKWIGDNPNKGLGAVSYGAWSLEIHEAYDPALKWVLPLTVSGPLPLTLFAVWTVPSGPSNTYIQCLFDAFGKYGSLLRGENVVVAGDLNQNVSFDEPRHPLKFRTLLDQFQAIGLESLYHLDRKCHHGEEKEPTFYMHHAVEKPHHLDYAFASECLRRRGFSFDVGGHADWSKMSDHVPLSCQLQ
jgi:hypothetical protein